MNSERWRQIEEAFHGTLEHGGGDRETYLLGVCGADQELYKEVMTLVSCYELPGDFLEKSQVTLGLNILAARNSELKKNEAVGPYVVERRIGRGGMGDVYLVRDQRLGRQAALKLMPKSFENHPDWVGRFRHEARAASSIAHPNVAHIYEVGEFEGRHYIAMEYIDGVTLRAHLTKRGRLTASEAIDVSIQVAKALMAAHSVGVLHRDIKPDNIMIYGDGYVKVLDFGLAKSNAPFKSEASGEALVSVIETEAGIIVGSPAYMSPEQARALKVDHRSDLWSMGVVLYELLTGRNPFVSETPTDTIAAILKSEPWPLGVWAPGPSEKGQPIITRLLAKNVEDRYQDAQSLIDDLQSLKEELKYRTLDHPTESIVTTGLSAEKAFANLTQQQSRRLLGSVASVPAYVIRAAKPTKFSVIAGVLLIIATLIIARFANFSTEIHASPITSVAVLPFANRNGDSNSQYISDGLSEALIGRLSRLSRLRVIARDSSFKYRGKAGAPKEVAKDLSVQAVVVGTVTKQGDDLQLSVELLDANRMRQLWTGQYRYKTSELPIVLNDVSRKIASNLNLNLTGDDLNLITRRDKGEGNSYEWYLKGRFYWSQLTEEAVDKSVECFNEALAIDPDYALAYTGLANSYITLGAAYRSSEDMFRRAELNARKALNIDGDLAEAHYAMAVTHYVYHWDLPAAESEAKRALELNPNFAIANSLLSSVSLGRGDLSQATSHINRALELDPFSLLFNSRLSYIYYCQRDAEKQLQLIQNFLNREPSSSLFYNDMALAYTQMGKFDDALAASQRAMILIGQDPDTLSTLGVVYARANKREDAKWITESLKELSMKKYVPPYLIALIYCALGDNDQAFAWLEKAVQRHDSYILRVKVEPVFDGLRSDVRYYKLLRSINF